MSQTHCTYLAKFILFEEEMSVIFQLEICLILLGHFLVGFMSQILGIQLSVFYFQVGAMPFDEEWENLHCLALSAHCTWHANTKCKVNILFLDFLDFFT